jgi:hypothetical protein
VTSRFVSNLVVLLAGAFLAAASFAFAAAALGWIDVAAGCLAVLVVLAAFTRRGRGPAQRWLDAVAALGSSWAIVAARTFSGATLRWLTFANGVTLLAVGVVALVVHEVYLELAVRRSRALRADGPLVAAADRATVGLTG